MGQKSNKNDAFVFKWCSKTLQWQGERTYHAQRPCEACVCRDVLPARQQGITIVIPYFSLVYKTEPLERELTGKTIAVDMGEIHPIVSHYGENTIIYNGRFLRSLRRYREKIKAYFQAKMDISKRWSNRWHNLRRAKNKVLAKLDAQITDAEHKITSRFVSDCKKAKADTIVIGDLKGIRTKIKYGKKTNQKLHHWPFHRIASLIEYKAALNGIKVEFVSEAYTSQTCPCCGNRHKPSNRNYKCKKCGFESHRDGVGAINIWNESIGMVHPSRSWGDGVPHRCPFSLAPVSLMSLCS